MKKTLILMFFSVISLFAFEELNNNDFQFKIQGKNTIIDFYAKWCYPCKKLDDNLKKFLKVKPKEVTIYKVNIDNEFALARKYGIKKLPSTIYFKDGIPVKTIVGVQSVQNLKINSNKLFDLHNK